MKTILSSTYLGLFSLLEESFLSLLFLVLLLGEIIRSRHFLKNGLVNTGEIDPTAGGDNVASVHPPEWHAIDLEGTCNKENTLGQVFEKDDTLAAESTGKQNQDSTGLETLSRFGRIDGLADLEFKKSGG